MEQERVPNFDKGPPHPLPAVDAAGSEQSGELFSGTSYWARFSDVKLTSNGCDVTVTGISGDWWWVYARDSSGNRLDWSWCTKDKKVSLKCDPNKIDKVILAWQGDSKLAGWMSIAYTTP